MKKFNIEVEVVREMYYNEESMYGIYACVPVTHNNEITLNKFGNISLKGNSRRLSAGQTYKVEFEGAFSDDYGSYYKIIQVETEKLDTVESQDRFLKAILSETHFNSLKKAYPNELIVDLIMGDKIDIAKTKGIKEASLAKIKEKVKENASISILIAKLDDLEISVNAISKLVDHFKSPDAVINKINESIYNLCQVKYFGFLTVDKIAMKRGDDPTNKNRIEACFNYIIQNNSKEGHTWMHMYDLLEKANDLLKIDEILVKDALSQLAMDGTLYVDNERVASPHLRRQEHQIYKHLKRIHSTYKLTHKDDEQISERLKSIEKEQGFEFTDEQRNVILSGINHGVMVLNGGGGTGKTSTVKGIIDSLGTENYMTAALSGKAVRVLSQRNIKASTIHRMLAYKRHEFEFNEMFPLSYEAVVVDEASMIDIGLFLSVLRAIPDGCKLIIVGDSGQLPAIGSGDVLRDLLQTKEFPVYELTKIHRQAAKSGILSLANSVRSGKQITPYDSQSKTVHGELKDQVVISYADNNNLVSDIIKICKNYKPKINSDEDLLEFQVLVANRERGELSVKSLNNKLQRVFNDMSKPFLSRGGYEYREGDKIIAIGNTYDLEPYEDVEEFKLDIDKDFEYVMRKTNKNKEKVTIYNGTMGIVKDIYKNNLLIQFENIDGIIAIDAKDNLDKIDMAYAITVHRSQGSTIKNVIFALDFGAYKLLSRQLVYTAISRASGKCVILCQSNAMYTAIKNDASGNRRTFLADIIKSNRS